MQSSSSSLSSQPSSSSTPSQLGIMKQGAIEFLTGELKKCDGNLKNFRFDHVYLFLTNLCKEFNISLESVRTPDDYTLLHLMVKAKNVDAVKKLTAGNNPSQHIPRNVKHNSTNNLLHFCGLWAQSDIQQIEKGQVQSLVNKELIEIIKILGDTNHSDHLPLDVEKSVRHRDGGTHAHAACMYNANDIMTLYFIHNKNVYEITRHDKRTANSFAQHRPNIPPFFRALQLAYRQYKANHPNITDTDIDILTLYSNACLAHSSSIATYNHITQHLNANLPPHSAPITSNANRINAPLSSASVPSQNFSINLIPASPHSLPAVSSVANRNLHQSPSNQAVSKTLNPAVSSATSSANRTVSVPFSSNHPKNILSVPVDQPKIVLTHPSGQVSSLTNDVPSSNSSNTNSLAIPTSSPTSTSTQRVGLFSGAANISLNNFHSAFKNVNSISNSSTALLRTLSARTTSVFATRTNNKTLTSSNIDAGASLLNLLSQSSPNTPSASRSSSTNTPLNERGKRKEMSQDVDQNKNTEMKKEEDDKNAKQKLKK